MSKSNVEVTRINQLAVASASSFLDVVDQRIEIQFQSIIHHLQEFESCTSASQISSILAVAKLAITLVVVLSPVSQRLHNTPKLPACKALDGVIACALLREVRTQNYRRR